MSAVHSPPGDRVGYDHEVLAAAAALAVVDTVRGLRGLIDRQAIVVWGFSDGRKVPYCGLADGGRKPRKEA